MTNYATNTTVLSWLVHLVTLTPPNGVLYIGTGSGTGQWMRWLQQANVPNVTLVEPDDTRFTHLRCSFEGREDWHLRQQVVTQAGEIATFYQASLSTENGLLDPEALCELWPNIKKRQTLLLESTSIAKLQEESETRATWLMVDCLPALPIVHGAGDWLESFDVIVVRTLVNDSIQLEAGASEAEVLHYLTTRGYRHLGTEIGRHPAIGHSIFLRDARTVEQLLRRELFEVNNALQINAHRLELAYAATDELTAKSGDEINRLETATAAAESMAAAQHSQVVHLREQIRDLRAQADEALQAEVQRNKQKQDDLRHAWEAQAKLAAESAVQLDQVTRDKKVAEMRMLELAKQVEGMQRAKAQAEQLAKTLEARQSEMEAEKESWKAEKSAFTNALDDARQFSIEGAARIASLEHELLLLRARSANTELGPPSADSKPNVLSKPVKTTRTFAKDADIADMITDVAPFFRGRSLTYVDVGAFAGEVFLSLKTSKDIKIREAHLFEPNPASYKILQDNIKNINIPSLHCYNVGLASLQGERQFMSAGSMTKIVDSPIKVDGASSFFEANCHPLDDFIVNFTDGHIDFLKIDVEGKELEVLGGARNLLSRQEIDFIYLEAGFNKNGTQQTYFCSLDAVLQNFGYRVFKIYEQINEWQKDSPLLRRCNVAYMSERFAAANSYSSVMEIYRLRQEVDAVKSAVS
ncbi:FkbM family methyltransferase [Cupriavidus alkaliphilus]|uniref:FkbM family methyltransferase n=1 Tax=Cupriavidus alkaliphilus TaxID=942866 RepID=UPI00339D952A